ncbi:MAG: DUF5675 family protein [Elusimicrobia bacterium]|nr:DUF5675 family protein [Elusimicrobiota bacterium]
MYKGAILTRILKISGPDGTFGGWESWSGFKCVTIEPPWEMNAVGYSCIFPGIYICKNLWSNAHQAFLYHVLGTCRRENVEIHSANWAGDRLKGKVSQLLGCIAPGSSIADIALPASFGKPAGAKQLGVTDSKNTLAALMADMNGEDFQLTIKEA